MMASVIKWLFKQTDPITGREVWEDVIMFERENRPRPLRLQSSADRIRAADKRKEHLLKRVLLKAVKSGRDELCLRGESALKFQG